jgi:hypothetical protein
MPDRLSIYNAALGHLAERKLASLTEARGSRRSLDTVWDSGLIRYVLEQGFWNFATKTVEATYSPSVEPDFGFVRAFDKPSDWVRTAQVSGDSYFSYPLDHHLDERGYWWADLDTIYVRYISDAEDYGSDLSLWPETFTRYVEAYLAFRSADKITGSASKEERMEKLTKKLLIDARSKDAMNQPKQFPPKGTWVNARHSRFSRPDRARGNLIG